MFAFLVDMEVDCCSLVLDGSYKEPLMRRDAAMCSLNEREWLLMVLSRVFPE